MTKLYDIVSLTGMFTSLLSFGKCYPIYISSSAQYMTLLVYLRAKLMINSRENLT